MRVDRKPTEPADGLKMPNRAVIETEDGIQRCSIEEWQSKPQAQRIQILARRQVTFYSDEEPMTAKDALHMISKASH